MVKVATRLQLICKEETNETIVITVSIPAEGRKILSISVHGTDY
jgi:hypothetical protein